MLTTETVSQQTQSGFEGPEKLLEIWFKGPTSLHQITQSQWQNILDIVKCKILSTIKNDHTTAYLLSESSMFVYEHKLILKTCGTTTLLSAIPTILELVSSISLIVDSIFYSRKAFFFPEKQEFPHGVWSDEVEYLDSIFKGFNTAGYVIGKINGDHWCLYVATPMCNSDLNLIGPSSLGKEIANGIGGKIEKEITLEILMLDLDPEKMQKFWKSSSKDLKVFRINKLNIYKDAQVDDHLFDPCGYSVNGLLDNFYYTIHVTPELHCSYASFETCVPFDNLNDLVLRVVDIFGPAKFSTTLFSMNCPMNLDCAVDGFKCRDRIIHSLPGWDLMFCHYEK